jgi:hypothetical protein
MVEFLKSPKVGAVYAPEPTEARDVLPATPWAKVQESWMREMLRQPAG